MSRASGRAVESSRLHPEPTSTNAGGDAAGETSTSTEARVIARLAAPISLAQFGLMALGLVDVAILGRASTEELGGASIGRSIGFAAVALSMGASSALEPLASQAIGGREPAKAFRALVGTLAALVLLWVPTSAIAFGSTYLLAPFGIEAELVRPARAFLLGHVPGMLAFPVFLAAKTFLQAHTRTAPALVGAVVANVVNFLVCNVLVRGDAAFHDVGIATHGFPELGALGAGLASSISSILLAAFVLVASLRERHRHAADGVTSPLGVEVKRVLSLGVPIGLQLLAEIGVFSVVAVVAGHLGKIAVAAHQVAISLASFTFMGVLGISSATAVRVGHAVGAGRPPRRAGLVGIGLGALFMTVSGVFFVVASHDVVGLFTSDPEVRELGASLLVVAAAFQLVDGIQGVAAGALRGAGDVRFAFVANVAAHWAVGFPVALLLAFRMGLGARGLWWGLAIGLALVATALTARFVRISRR